MTKVIKHVPFPRGCVCLLDNGMVEILGESTSRLVRNLRDVFAYLDDVQDIGNAFERLSLTREAEQYKGDVVYYKRNGLWYNGGGVELFMEPARCVVRPVLDICQRVYAKDGYWYAPSNERQSDVPIPELFKPRTCFMAGLDRIPCSQKEHPRFVCLSSAGEVYVNAPVGRESSDKWYPFRDRFLGRLPTVLDVFLVRDVVVALLDCRLLHPILLVGGNAALVPEYLQWKGTCK